MSNCGAGFLARFLTFRTFAIASMLLGLAPAMATACAIGWPIKIFFDRVPKDIESFVVLEVTLVDVSSSGDLFWVARVDRAINGHADGETVKLFYNPGPCEMFLPKLGHGIIVGTFRNEAANELLVVSQRQWDARATSRPSPEPHRERDDK